MTQSTGRHHTILARVTAAAVAAFALAQWPVTATPAGQDVTRPPAAVRPCGIRGVVRSGDTPIPGAAVTAREGDRVHAVSSTDTEGAYRLAVSPGTYQLRIELSAFAPVEHAVVVAASACEVLADATLVLASRVPGGALPPVAATPPSDLAATVPGGRGGRGGRGVAGAPRFQALTVSQAETDQSSPGALALTSTVAPEDDPAARLLPPGFASGSTGDAVTVSGSLVQLDRTLMNDRNAALGRGEFGLGDDQPFGQIAPVAAAGQGGDAAGGRGGRGGGLGGVGRGGGGGRLQVNATYGLGGSMFDAAPYSLRGEATTKREYLQQNMSTTIGGPFKVPGVYDGTNRTTFNASYTAARNENLFDQYATVPSEAYRNGDFSASPVAILDPLTGQPFPNNVIPRDRMSTAALSLLPFVPVANLSGDTRNYHRTDTTESATDTFTIRLTHAFTQPPVGRGGRAGGAARGGGPAGGGGGAAPGGGAQAGRGGRGAFQPPLNVTMTATLNYRKNRGDQNNVFPLLSGTTRGATWSVPVTLNIRAGRSVHAINGSIGRTTSSTLNAFAFQRDIAGLAGITGVATDPFDWGVPSLTFGTFTALRDVAPSRRTDRSFQLGYGWTRPSGSHTWRVGGSYSQQLNTTQSDSNARGTFTFTGLYTAGGLTTVRGSGQDFADFLLGMPQQASRQYSVSPDNISQAVTIRGRQFNLYLQDDWRWKARWTINYGLQYDFTAPYTETGGRMVNLDAAADFSSVVPVGPNETGAFSGRYGSGLVDPDWNNLAPRIGVAWRATNAAVVRFGYGLSYNSGSYSTIARNLYQQPPFFLTATRVGSLADPLWLTDAFADIAPSTVTNNYGIQKDYQLGLIHQWTADYSRTLFSTWNVGATYIGTRGSSLDLLRAPNRGPSGLRIDGVQAFTWQSSGGESYMNGLSLRLQKRQSRGVSGSLSYTLSKSRDNTTATSGNATVAQDDQNLDAEWALSNFDRRHQLTGSASIELPWGRNRRWLADGGLLAAVFGDWSATTNVTWQSGTPLTARCTSCAADVAQGVVGTLRADYTGAAIALEQPGIDQFFNTAAFAIPAAGAFGSAGRNVITGPGSHLVNAQFTRDLTLGGTRGVSINVNANNLFNTVNYQSVDTNVNSPTFGQVLSVNGRRTVRLSLRFRF